MVRDDMRPIPGFDGYLATRDGKVWSTKTLRFLRPIKGSNYGHLNVGLYRNTFLEMVGIHRCVLLAFVGPAPEGTECRHLNGNAADNRLENLCWGTHTENMQDRIRHGRFFQPDNRGEKCATHKLTEAQVLEIRRRYVPGVVTQRELSQEFGVCIPQISDIVNGREWKYLVR
jgi:hypothetical protein